MLEFGHVNIRSLSANFQNFRDLILESNYQFFAITETWLAPQFNDQMIAIPGYNFSHIPRQTRGGGVGIYIKCSIKYEVIFRDIKTTIEEMWVRFRLGGRTIIVGVVYRPGGDVNSFISNFENSLSTLITMGDEIICLGDFNINAFNVFSAAYSAFSTVLDSFCFKQLINEPTRITPYSSTLIDFVIVHSDALVLESGVRDVRSLADHAVVYCVLDLELVPSAPVVRTFRDYRFFDLNNFNHDLINLPWNDILYIEDIDEKVGLFNNIISDLFDRHAPFTTRSFNKPFKPWYNENVHFLMNRRNNARRKYERTNDLQDLNYYRQLRNYTTYLQRHEKKAYLNSCFSSGNIKDLWSNIRKFGIQSKKSEIPEHLRNVDVINNYFVAAQNDSPADENLQFFYNNNIHHSVTDLFVFQLTTEEEILKIISSIKSDAVGADGIGIKMLSLCCPFIVKYLCHIFNTCLLLNVFPTCWKESYVIPIPKCSNVNDLSDLRPITILPLVSKIFEKVVSSQLYQHLLLFKILPETQSGFREGFSCSTALANLTDGILRNTDDGLVTALVLLDFSRAFDTINHNLLLSILHFIGLGEGPEALFASYLGDRQQRVVLPGVSSEAALIKSGVPQGSVLGPLLFLIYTAKLPNSIRFGSIHMYADDTQICHAITPQSPFDGIRQLESDVENLVVSAEMHNLNINPSKSSIIIFGNRVARNSVKDNVIISVNDAVIPVVDAVKSLGVYFDSELRFKLHITKCLQLGYSVLKLLYSSRYLLSQHIRKILCDSLVLSKLNYCDTVYHHCLDSRDHRRIQVLQNACLRFIYGVRRREHISPFLARSGWLCMRDRRELHVASFYHKILLEKSPPYLYNKIRFRTDVHNINIRHRHFLTIPNHRLEIFKRSFSYRISCVYNNIPSDFKSLSVVSFKRRLKSALLNGEVTF